MLAAKKCIVVFSSPPQNQVATMGIADDIGGIVALVAVIVTLLVKLGPLRKDHILLISNMLLACNCLVGVAMEEEAMTAAIDLQTVKTTTAVIFNDYYENCNKKRSRLSASEYELRKGRKRMECRHNHGRAKQCILEDWMGDDRIFTDRQFQQVFRVTRGIVERLIQACGNFEPTHFGERSNCVGKPGIAVDVKVLGILKCVAFGCSGRAFMDYHQMAPNTFTESLKAFFHAIKADTELHATYMRSPDKADVKKITDQHLRVHGVPGMLGCLDCLHVYWKNCPVGWQGQFKNGRYKYSSVVVEAMVDPNLWFWHASIGHTGTNSDTNIWDVSPLLQAFLSEEWARDCAFESNLTEQSSTRHGYWWMVSIRVLQGL
jgi:Plant transposon protein